MITPKEKAKELVEMFGIELAPLVVDEIYFGIYNYLKDTDELQNADREFAYWNSV